MVKLRHDSEPYVIQADKGTIEMFAKRVLKWRTPLKYDSIYERLMHTGSVNFNRVISAMWVAGYGVK